MEALRPFLKLKPASCKLDEICFGCACHGGKCPGIHYKRPHIVMDCGMRTSSQANREPICTWLALPAVKARVRLTLAARKFARIRCPQATPTVP